MHKIFDYNEVGESVSYSLRYTFERSLSDITEHRSFTTKEEALRFYFWHVSEYLLFLVNDITAFAADIQPYYFDRSSTPFMAFDAGWRANYWEFKSLLTVLQRTSSAGEYSTIILERIRIIEKLVPERTDFYKARITQTAADIREAATKVQEAIQKLKTLTDEKTI